MTLTEQILYIDEEKINTSSLPFDQLFFQKVDSIIHHQNQG